MSSVPKDTVNCIAFTPEASHLFTCSNDGTIAAIRCGNWQMEKHWLKPHKGLAVNTLAIHPTGKIALSAGADGILRTWNLIKGRQAYATNLVPRLKLDAKNVNVLKWSPNGEKYLLAVNQRIDVYSVELAGIDSEIEFDSKIVCVEFLKDDLIAVGLENGQIKLYDLEKSVQTVEAIAHDIRVKCMAFKNNLLVTASSSGEIKLWKYSRHRLDMLQKINCGARITCLSLAMTDENLVRDKEAPPQEEREIRKERKFRFRQEVVVEKEGDWEVSSIHDPPSRLADKKTKKSKAKRGIEDVQSPNIPREKKSKAILKKKKIKDDLVAEPIPKKKKKLSKKNQSDGDKNENDEENDKEASIKKRKKRATLLEENNNAPSKRTKKKTSEKIAEKRSTTTQEESKATETKENLKVSSKKRKREAAIEESGMVQRKKKKKQ